MPGCHCLVSEGGGGAGQPTMIFPDSSDSCEDVNRSWRMAGSAAPLHLGPSPDAGEAFSAMVMVGGCCI